MKIQQNFLEETQENFLEKTQRNFSEFFNKIFQDRNGEDFPQSFVEGAVKNFNMAVNSIGEKTKEVEQDIRKRWCDYPSS